MDIRDDVNRTSSIYICREHQLYNEWGSWRWSRGLENSTLKQNRLAASNKKEWRNEPSYSRYFRYRYRSPFLCHSFPLFYHPRLDYSHVLCRLHYHTGICLHHHHQLIHHHPDLHLSYRLLLSSRQCQHSLCYLQNLHHYLYHFLSWW